jgi:hypothetical protein
MSKKGGGKERLPRIYFAAPAYRVTGEPAKPGYVGSYFTTADLKQFVQNFNAKKHSYYGANEREKLARPRIFEVGYLHPDLEGKKDRIGEQRDLFVDDKSRLITICRLNPLSEGGKKVTEMLMNDPTAKVGVSLDYETQKIERSDDPEWVKYHKYLTGISIVPQPAYKYGYVMQWATSERDLLKKLFAQGTPMMGGSEDAADDSAANSAAEAKGAISATSSVKIAASKAARPVFIGKNLRARVVKATGSPPLANVMKASSTAKPDPTSPGVDAEGLEEKDEGEEEDDDEDENEKFGDEDDEEEEEEEEEKADGEADDAMNLDEEEAVPRARLPPTSAIAKTTRKETADKSKKAASGAALPEPEEEEEDGMDLDDSAAVFDKKAQSTKTAKPRNIQEKNPATSSGKRQSSLPVSSPTSDDKEKSKQQQEEMADEQQERGVLDKIKKYPVPERAATSKDSQKRKAGAPIRRQATGAAAPKTLRQGEDKRASPGTSRPGAASKKKVAAVPTKTMKRQREEDAMDLDEEADGKARPEPEEDEEEEQEEEELEGDVGEEEDVRSKKTMRRVQGKSKRDEEAMDLDGEEEEEEEAHEEAAEGEEEQDAEGEADEDPYAIDHDDVKQILDDKDAAEEELQDMLELDTPDKQQAFYNLALREKAQQFIQKNKLAGDAVEILLEKVGAPKDERSTLRDIQARMMSGRDVSKLERKEFAEAMAAAAGRFGSADAAHPALVEKKLGASDRQKKAAAAESLRSTAPLTGGGGLVRKKAAASKAGVGAWSISVDGGKTQSQPMSWASSAFEQTFASHDPIRRSAPVDPFSASVSRSGRQSSAPDVPLPMHVPSPRLTGGRGGADGGGGKRVPAPKKEPTERERSIAWAAQRFDMSHGRKMNADETFIAAISRDDPRYASYKQPVKESRGWMDEFGFTQMSEKLAEITKRNNVVPFWQQVAERIVYPTQRVGTNPTEHEVYKHGYSGLHEGDPASYTGFVPRTVHSGEPLVIGEEGDTDSMRVSAAGRGITAY